MITILRSEGVKNILDNFLPRPFHHFLNHNSFPAGGDFCCLLITFANSLDPEQARKNVRPDLDTPMVFPKYFFEKVI